MLFSKGNIIDGDYTVTFPHKQGSYAETYRVKDEQGKNRFLKLISHNKLRPSRTDNHGRAIEAEIARRVEHANLCRTFDAQQIVVNGSVYTYIVSEFVSGETLAQKMVRDSSLSVYEIKEIAKAVLRALQYLHTQPTPIIHGEVTTQNVLINLVGELSDLKLIDFGHAIFLNTLQGKDDLEELNYFYLAPERFSGTACIQSDLYSVGVMMFQMLYGKLPWFINLSHVKPKNQMEAVLAERNKPLHAPSVELFELDEQLENTIIKALCQDVDDRFQSADEFIKAIDGTFKVGRITPQKKILSNTELASRKNIPVQVAQGKGFSAVAGMDALKSILREEIIEPLHNPEEYERYGITIPNGMLLYGPLGCGKTFFAKHFAEEVGFNFMLVTPATLKSRYVNATQENIAKMFADAQENAPTIIFIDEINELVPDRESDMHEMSRSAVNEMLAQMDRTGERGIFIIGATNYPHTIDPAMMRAGRLDKKYYVGPPDETARKSLFQLYLSKRPIDFGIDYAELAQLTDGFVSADIQLIVNDASRVALKMRTKITMDILRDVISTTKPSVNRDELIRYEDIKRKIEGETISKRKRVGFK